MIMKPYPIFLLLLMMTWNPTWSKFFASHNDCPADVFIVLDTSESVALRGPPFGYLVESIKAFAVDLVSQMNSRFLKCDRLLTWKAGALHYSDEVKLISEMVSMDTQMANLRKSIEDVLYLGKGTHADCAITMATEQLLTGGGHMTENKFMVIVTDGHISGYKEPCGGVNSALTEAKASKIKMFSIAITPDHMPELINDIATDSRYIHNITADDDKLQSINTVTQIINQILEDTQSSCCTFQCEALRGPPGLPGPTGDPGSEGKKGPFGTLGDPGPKGAIGEMGPPGHAGIKGACGPFGTKGFKGLKGPKGDKGRHGNDGEHGKKGEPGPPGFPGCKGEVGPEGNPGLPGQKGDPGPYGKKGMKGEKGTDGTQGLPGAPGGTGEKGVPGPKGQKGNKGERGNEGDMGRPGFIGKKGEKGEHGMRGPPGNPGARGEKGKTGPLGPPGHEGMAGEIGCTGEPGPVGMNGFKGEPGLMGPEGEKGNKGQPGPRGEPGLPGERGEDGEPGLGIPGATGFQGMKGYPGTKGDEGLPGDHGDDNDLPGNEGEKGLKGYPGSLGDPGPTGMPGLPGPNECEILDIIQRMTSCCECQCGPVMLLFILDSSESVGLSNFTLQKEFILRVITKITKQGRKMELGGNRIAVIQYSHEGKQELLSTDDPNMKILSTFRSAVKKMNWIAGGTYTGEALDVAKKTLEESILTHKVVVMLTDGRSDSRDQNSLASLCTIPNLNVIGIGVGDKLMKPPQMKVLQEISCAKTRNEGMHIRVTEYYELLDDSILHNVTQYICRGSTCPDFTCHVEFDQPTDLVFLVDGSSSVGHNNFDQVKEFVKVVATKILSEEMNINNLLRLSVVQYSNAGAQKLEVPFTSNIEDVTSGISKVIYMDKGTDLPAALRYVMNYLKMDGRPNVKKQIIVFSDGRSSGIAQNQIAAQAAELLSTKTELFAITVGTFHELGICQLVSGKQSNFNFNQIENKILRVLEYSDLRKRVNLQSLLKKMTS